MSFSAVIIADSISPDGSRLTSFQLRYPRFIHAEVLTHRVFTRNASSSRAIPVERMIQDVLDDPAMPIYWGKNQPGMQAAVELTGKELFATKAEWLLARDGAVRSARVLTSMGAHKQIVNRVLEPFGHIRVLVTATEFNNWFALRDHKDAMPEIQHLAQLMKAARELSEPKLLQPGQWHLPYVDAQIEDNGHQSYRHHLTAPEDSVQGVKFMELNQAICVSVARCARNSYRLHDGSASTIAQDIALHDKLLAATPLHASPAEHQASPYSVEAFGANQFGADDTKRKLCGNFAPGWVQYRKLLPNEYVPG